MKHALTVEVKELIKRRDKTWSANKRKFIYIGILTGASSA